jgi:hypothetical protein
MRPARYGNPPSVFDVVHRAVEICDPEGADGALSDFLARFEDRDEPVSALGPDSEREFFEAAEWVQGDLPDPALVMAAAVATYLAYRRDEVADDPVDILRLAARAEFDDHPPDDVAAWLADGDIQV